MLGARRRAPARNSDSRLEGFGNLRKLAFHTDIINAFDFFWEWNCQQRYHVSTFNHIQMLLSAHFSLLSFLVPALIYLPKPFFFIEQDGLPKELGGIFVSSNTQKAVTDSFKFLCESFLFVRRNYFDGFHQIFFRVFKFPGAVVFLFLGRVF